MFCPVNKCRESLVYWNLESENNAILIYDDGLSSVAMFGLLSHTLHYNFLVPDEDSNQNVQWKHTTTDHYARTMTYLNSFVNTMTWCRKWTPWTSTIIVTYPMVSAYFPATHSCDNFPWEFPGCWYVVVSDYLVHLYFPVETTKPLTVAFLVLFPSSLRVHCSYRLKFLISSLIVRLTSSQICTPFSAPQDSISLHAWGLSATHQVITR